MKKDNILDKALSKELNNFAGSNPLLEPLGDQLPEENYALSPERIGRFTGSSSKKLMSCKSRAKGKSWDQVKWIIDLGDTALRYICEKATERIIGEQAETIENKYTRWGKHYEDEGKAFFKEKYRVNSQEVDFTPYLKNAGATPDGVLCEGFLCIKNEAIALSDKNKCVFELKCPETVWSNYKLGLFGVDESHEYFWQLQAEMLSMKTDRFLFCYYDPRFPDDIKIKHHKGYLSKIHTDALKARIIIGERLINRLIETNLECNIWEELPEAVKDIPTDYQDFLIWLDEAIKPLEL